MSLSLEPEEKKESEFIKLVSKDGQEFVCKRELGMASGTIRAMLTGPGKWKETSGPIPTIQFEGITSDTLEKVVQYFHYKKQFDNTKGPAEKFDIQINQIIPLLLAAEFLDT